VVIDGFGVGVAERFGIGYELLRSEMPSLVYCSVSGFGQHGEYANLKAYEGIVGAKVGQFMLGTGGQHGWRPGPIFVGANLASCGAGHMATSGILAALIAREHTGRGQRVDATLAQGLTPSDYFGTMTWQWA
jgi:crotonobetainyl-CoA:carnitine CoA-transferase CaiB-like acyl-CoA transferase